MGAARLIDKVKAHLREVGYEEVAPNPQGGGIWAHPQWGEGTGKIMQAIEDCFERES